MSSGIQVKFSGIKELDDLLKKLPAQVERKVLLSAQRDVLKPVAKDMQSKLDGVAGKVTGNLRSSIGIKAMRGGKTYNAASLAGVRYGNRYKGFHGRFIEGGTKQRFPRKKKVLRFMGSDGRMVFVRSAAPMVAKPFMEPTIKQHMPRIQKEYPDSLLSAMVKYMKRKLK